jgi:hypothetical protein
MTTMMTPRTADLLANLHQLVLFPDVLGVRSVPLALCQKAETSPVQEQEERFLTYHQTLDAEQLPLFA